MDEIKARNGSSGRNLVRTLFFISLLIIAIPVLLSQQKPPGQPPGKRRMVT
jgi:hypothetical protein